MQSIIEHTQLHLQRWGRASTGSKDEDTGKVGRWIHKWLCESLRAMLCLGRTVCFVRIQFAIVYYHYL
uniref:Uncharacterized protein n=1 Tax=Hyaloperonospora arabidopsidis (strain Emoy2) TaxID=559515 RepID=M4BSS3_HYAAE